MEIEILPYPRLHVCQPTLTLFGIGRKDGVMKAKPCRSVSGTPSRVLMGGTGCVVMDVYIPTDRHNISVYHSRVEARARRFELLHTVNFNFNQATNKLSVIYNKE